MKIEWSLLTILLLPISAVHTRSAEPPLPDKALFDFEKDSDSAVWSVAELGGSKRKEPPVILALDDQNASSGRRCLKITFTGGEWPTVATTNVPSDWTGYQTFKAEVTVSRPCLVGFLAMQEKSSRDRSWEGVTSRWVKTALLRPGKNEISEPLHPPNEYAISKRYGSIVSFEIFMYQPFPNESVYVDNIRLSATKEKPTADTTEFKVAGTDLTVKDVRQLNNRLKSEWKPPLLKTLDEVEADFRTTFAQVKKEHPNARLAVLRDGEKGFDPTQPDRVYDGWKDAYFSSHGPDGMTVERAENFGHSETQEIFMRHRCPLMRVDLSVIPIGSTIHAAKLIVVRANTNYDQDRNPETNANMWAVEPCNRDWSEYECNAYEYAKGKFWREVGGRYYGDDPDFLPFYLAHGPGTGRVNVLDFTEAVKFWTDGQHPNHGFMLHCDEHDWIQRACYREAKQIRNRPAVLIIYTPPPPS